MPGSYAQRTTPGANACREDGLGWAMPSEGSQPECSLPECSQPENVAWQNAACQNAAYQNAAYHNAGFYFNFTAQLPPTYQQGLGSPEVVGKQTWEGVTDNKFEIVL